MEGPGEEEGENGEQVLTGTPPLQKKEGNRERTNESGNEHRGETLLSQGTKGIPGTVINKKDNASPQALGYSSLWFIFT